MNNLILITGGNGFIGKNFIKSYHNKITIIKINSKKILKKKKYLDILKKIFIKYKPKTIIHFAGYFTKTNSIKDNKVSKKINFEYFIFFKII